MVDTTASGSIRTLPSMNDSDECSTCGQTLGWHKKNKPVHEFNGSGVSLDASASEVSRKREDAAAGQSDEQVKRDHIKRALGHDAVLRLLLIQAKVITQEDLDATERTIIDTVLQGSQLVRVDYGDEAPRTGTGPSDPPDHGTGDEGQPS